MNQWGENAVGRKISIWMDTTKGRREWTGTIKKYRKGKGKQKASYQVWWDWMDETKGHFPLWIKVRSGMKLLNAPGNAPGQK